VTEIPRPGCPPWCAGTCGSGTPEYRYHQDEGHGGALRPGADPMVPETGYLFAYAAARGDSGPRVTLNVKPRDGSWAFASLMPPADAEAVAVLAELLAGSGPEAHRMVAAAIRAAIATGKQHDTAEADHG
jgi:hypothetical protein